MNPAYPQPNQQQKYPAYPQSPELKASGGGRSTIRTIIRVLYTLIQSTKFLLAIACFAIPVVLNWALKDIAAGNGGKGKGDEIEVFFESMKSLLQTPAFVSGIIFVILVILGILLIFISHKLTTRIMFGVYCAIAIGFYAYLAIYYNRTVTPFLDGVDNKLNDAMWTSHTTQDRALFQIQYKCCGFKDPSDQPVQPCPPGATKGCYSIMAQMAQQAGVPLPKNENITSPVRYWAKIGYVIVVVTEVVVVGLAAVVLFI